MLLGDVNNILIFTDHVLKSKKKKKKLFMDKWTINGGVDGSMAQFEQTQSRF